MNHLYLRIDNASGYIEEVNKVKYLVFDVTDENKKLLERYDDVFNRIIGKIKKIDDDWLEYSKDYMKIKFSSDDNLPLNKPLKVYQMIVTIRWVFSEDNKIYQQVFLDEALYSLQKCWSMIELTFQKELMLIKQMNQKNVSLSLLVFPK